ncbi:unnamed protein product [Adineta steineri]|uniref:Uncharacterized protein n=1 Tax=Adineta steineri TaxID=433720 RepID=A0A818SLA6_9BILA|nr:unnamed protein product [Adineta steineri]CAF3674502.1 unnamed protein product [Adineta steineri]
MSDEDEQQTCSNTNLVNETNNRLLHEIKLKLQELTREKTKYNVEKLTQDSDFLQSEIDHLNHAIGDINKQILTQTYTKKNLNAKMAILRSNSALRYSNLKMALEIKERNEIELQKPDKSPAYRDLAQRKINSIIEALPQLQKQDEYNQRLQEAEDIQTTARNKREKLLESLNAKTRKHTETKQLLNDSTIQLPDLEQAIEKLRLEREHISNSLNRKNKRRRIPNKQQKLNDSPVQSFASLEQDTLEYETRQNNEQLEKIRLLLKYFHEKMSEHHVSNNDTPCSTPTTEIISPLYHPLTPFEEQTILSSYMDEKDYEHNPLIKTTTNQLTVAIAMKLPRNFIPLDINSPTTNEIIHSPYHQENIFEYKKELPSDIVGKYAGTSKKKQQQQSLHGKKNKKNKKNFGMKHSSQMIALYDDVCKSSGSSDTLPSIPMFEYELQPAVKALQLLEQSVESYLNELSRRHSGYLSIPLDEEHSDIVEDDIPDSALDTYSEASSLIEPTYFSKDLISVTPQLINIPEARSSSSSDDKKTIVSSASSPSSHHSHSKVDYHFSSNIPLTTVEELSPYLPPLTIHIAQMERQISDEGYRSVRNERQQQATGTNYNNNDKIPLLTRSSSYDCTEKVDKWLSNTIPSSSILTHDDILNLNNYTNFQATDIDNENENLIKSIIPVPND